MQVIIYSKLWKSKKTFFNWKALCFISNFDFINSPIGAGREGGRIRKIINFIIWNLFVVCQQGEVALQTKQIKYVIFTQKIR